MIIETSFLKAKEFKSNTFFVFENNEIAIAVIYYSDNTAKLTKLYGSADTNVLFLLQELMYKIEFTKKQ